MPFFLDRINRTSGFTQYRRYVENEQYLNELKKSTDDAINYQLIEVRRSLNENTQLVSRSVNDATAVFCGSLEAGFSEVKQSLEKANRHLENIDDSLREVGEGISELHCMLDWKTDQIIEQQVITNSYLENIAQLLQISDKERVRADHVRQGLIYLKIALEEGPTSEYYEDALDEFENAVKLQSRDYFSLYKLGFILMNSLKLLDIEQALHYFKLSAKYLKAQSFAT